MKNTTRLETAFKTYQREMVRLVSPPYTGAPGEYEQIKPKLEEARAVFLGELLKDEKEAIAFFSVNRLEMEWCFKDMLALFQSERVYDAVYNYYARNFPSKSPKEIELIVKRHM